MAGEPSPEGERPAIGADGDGGAHPDNSAAPPVSEAEALYTLTPEREQKIIAALDTADIQAVRTLIADLDYAETADLIEHLEADKRPLLIDAIREKFDPVVLTELDEAVCAEVVDHLGVPSLARAIARLESDDALELLSSLDEPRQRQVMRAIPASLRALLEEGLSFPEASAGRLMQRNLVAVPTLWTVGEVIDFMRDNDDLPHDFYDIFVVDPGYRLVGSLPLNRLLRSKRPVRIKDLMEVDLAAVRATDDQEDVARLFSNKDIVSAPVVDSHNRLIGVITVDDVVDVIEEEAEEDLMRLAGVRETDIYDAPLITTRKRLRWLLINIITAVIASNVISLFEATIEQVVALAVLMPIVASMGGNAGTQTLAIAVRALATKDLTSSNALRVVGKEIAVGALNGAIFAVIAGGIAWAWFGQIEIGAVIGSAMLVNLICAGFAGAAIPVALARIGVDPAVASGVFLTTVTDVVGFFAFLGLATWVLL